jgi:hypothetical protein
MHGSMFDGVIEKFYTGYGAYFTSDETYAEFFREVARDMAYAENPRMYLAFLKVERPKFFDGENEEQFHEFTGTRISSEELVAQGFDGEILQFADGHIDVRVTRPDQIWVIRSYTRS